ncbi:hypothetical protein C8R46DRAFT_1296111 [Mycena filopes]|nr:hypothetical protein C8R46DRAFT_1296111 [Mycena filopes]
MDIHPSSPAFPAELERMIFRTAASEWPRIIPVLMLTAWRVKEWCDGSGFHYALNRGLMLVTLRVEPLLYRIIHIAHGLDDPKHPSGVRDIPTIPIQRLLKIISAKPSSFFESACRYLLIQQDATNGTLDLILTACRQVTHCLSGFPMKSNLDTLNTLGYFSRLTIDVCGLFHPQVIDFQAALFRNVTHLEIIESPTSDEKAASYTGVALMPALTHISFFSIHICAALHPLFRTTLKGLQCIVSISPTDVESYDDDVRPYSDDDRFVLLKPIDFVDDWMRGATDGQDYWSLADTLIAARAAGTMDRRHYLVVPVAIEL